LSLCQVLGARVERTMFAIKAELKTKGLVLGNGPSLHRAFMKFRGPKALNDKLPVTTNQDLAWPPASIHQRVLLLAAMADCRLASRLH
jgi:hypothetical protein